MNKRKKSIVDHSLALFQEKGIQHTSVQDIIDRAGISKGTFYNYFSSKNECVSAILEEIRHEVSLSRSELLMGKDARDLDLLIQQITILANLNEKRGMSAIYEELLHSGDLELKQLVLQHRISELEWLAERLIEVYGEELRPHAFESSVIFYGMLNHLLFMRKLTRPSVKDMKSVASSVFHYMEYIIRSLIHDHTAVLDNDHLSSLKDQLHTMPIKRADAALLLKELLEEESSLSASQKELAQALLSELERQPMRRSVISALLQPFTEAFEQTADYKTAKQISIMVWFYLKQRRT
jgi:AcrR family transcriptional regulator